MSVFQDFIVANGTKTCKASHLQECDFFFISQKVFCRTHSYLEFHKEFPDEDRLHQYFFNSFFSHLRKGHGGFAEAFEDVSKFRF